MKIKITIIGLEVRGLGLCYLIQKYFKNKYKIIALCNLVKEKLLEISLTNSRKRILDER